MVSMNEMAEIVLSFENTNLPIHHIPGPEGVRGRNSDNTLIKEKLGWAPSMKLKVCNMELFISWHLSHEFLTWWCDHFLLFQQDGLRITYFWIKDQIEKEKVQGLDVSVYGSSKVVGTQAPVQLGSLRAADGKEWNSSSWNFITSTFRTPISAIWPEKQIQQKHRAKLLNLFCTSS